jgi:hypothetical protein
MPHPPSKIAGRSALFGILHHPGASAMAAAYKHTAVNFYRATALLHRPIKPPLASRVELVLGD